MVGTLAPEENITLFVLIRFLLSILFDLLPNTLFTFPRLTPDWLNSVTNFRLNSVTTT